MLTSLTIENLIAENIFVAFIYRLRGNKINVDIKSARGAVLRQVTYLNRTGRIDWDALDRVIGNQRNHLLCSEKIALPKELGYRRYDNTPFLGRLAINMAGFVLGRCGENCPKTGIYDPKGDYCELIGEIVRQSDALIVTDFPEKYEDIAERLSREYGVSLRLSCERSALSECELVVAPSKICEPIPLRDSAVILTCAPPAVCLSGAVYYRYHFRMPNMLERLKPAELSPAYFVGALFTKARRYELGSIIPTSCSGETSSQTVKSLERLFS